MTTKYNYTFGILSAFGILFVVLGHTGSDILTFDGWLDYYSFHMPLFFFISGYFFKDEKADHAVAYILHRAKKLLIPFYVWSFVYLMIQTYINYYSKTRGINAIIGNEFSWYNLFVYPWINNQPLGFNVSTWFLIALFLVEVINVLMTRIFRIMKLKNEHVKLLVALGICLIGVFMIQNNVLGFTKNMARSMYAFFFYQFGTWYKNFGEEHDKLSGTFYFLILAVIQYFMKIEYGILGFGVYGGGYFENTQVVMIAPIVGILFWLRVAKMLTPLLKDVKWIIYMGKNTMPIMIHHLFAIFVLQGFLYKFTDWVPYFEKAKYLGSVYYTYAPYEVMSTAYAVAGIAITLSCVYGVGKIKSLFVKA